MFEVNIFCSLKSSLLCQLWPHTSDPVHECECLTITSEVCFYTNLLFNPLLDHQLSWRLHLSGHLVSQIWIFVPENIWTFSLVCASSVLVSCFLHASCNWLFALSKVFLWLNSVMVSFALCAYIYVCIYTCICICGGNRAPVVIGALGAETPKLCEWLQ